MAAAVMRKRFFAAFKFLSAAAATGNWGIPVLFADCNFAENSHVPLLNLDVSFNDIRLVAAFPRPNFSPFSPFQTGISSTSSLICSIKEKASL